MPKFFAAQHHTGNKSSNASNPEFFYVCGGFAYGLVAGGFVHISTNGKAVSWYGGGTFVQLNEADTQYNYIAFG